MFVLQVFEKWKNGKGWSDDSRQFGWKENTRILREGEKQHASNTSLQQDDMV